MQHPVPKAIRGDAANEFHRLLAEVRAPAPLSEVGAAARAGRDISEVGALVCLKHVLETGDFDLLKELLQPDVRFVSKHHFVTGFGEVIALLRASHNSRNERLFDLKSRLAGSMTYQDLPELGLGLLMVDKRLPGPTLAALGRGFGQCEGVIGRYSVELARQSALPGTQSPLRISVISYSHFDDLVSGHAIFASVSCVCSIEQLAIATGFHIAAERADDGDLSLVIKTLTDSFAVELDADAVARVHKWLGAAEHGVDRCTVYLWQRCKIELHAIALEGGWVKLLIRSAREQERYDLSAILPLEEFLQRFRSALLVSTGADGGRDWLTSEQEHRNPGGASLRVAPPIYGCKVLDYIIGQPLSWD